MQTAPTDTSSLSLHDALPILAAARLHAEIPAVLRDDLDVDLAPRSIRFGIGRDVSDGVLSLDLPKDVLDRKSTRLNSSHSSISYAVSCLKKKTSHSLYCCFRR